MNLESYISGYIDGEGCFCVSIRPRNKNKLRWEVVAGFSVAQNENRAEVLRLIKNYFKCGFIRKNVCDKTLKFETRNLNALLTKIIPHFKRYPLLSSKQKDFETFEIICRKMKNGDHLTKKGIIEIMDLVSVMNSSGKRIYNKKKILDSFNEMKI